MLSSSARARLSIKKVRLVFTILLSLVSFTLFGLADTIAAYNSINTATNSIFDTGVNYASFSKSVKRINGDYEYWSPSNNYITLDELAVIKEKTGKNLIGVYKETNQIFSFSTHIGDTAVEGIDPSVIYTDSFSGIAAINENDLTDYGFTLLAGALPVGDKNEVAISKYVYDYFAKVGYVTFDKDHKEVKTEIKEYNDLIGQTLSFGLLYKQSYEFKIVGIVDTKFDYSRYEPLASNNAQFELSTIEIMALTEELEAARDYSFAAVGFVSSEIMKNVIEEKLSGEESLDGLGNAQLYFCSKDNINSYEDLYDKNGNSNFDSVDYISGYHSLAKVKDKIIWLDGEIEALKDNQIVIPMNAFRYLISGNNSTPEVFYNQEKLTGFEKTLIDKINNGEIWLEYWPDLSNFFSASKFFAAVKYAYENNADAKAKFAAHMNIELSEFESNYPNLEHDFLNMFATTAYREGAFADVITDSYVASYKNELIQRYNLSQYLTPQEIKDKLIVKFTYKDTEYYSYNSDNLTFNFNLNGNLESAIAYKYAAENFNDAMNFYALSHENNPTFVLFATADQILGSYASYLTNGGKYFGAQAPEGFIPTATKSYEDYKAELVVELGKANMKASNIILQSWSYNTGKENFIKDIEVVGVLKSDDEFRPIYVVSENIIDSMFGTNRGGIYAYVLGTMPADKAGINNLVKFSKTYMNDDGDVKFPLVNNVMSQLNMVDEILDILGQVFLYVGIGFAVFASLMLMNFISTSITYKKQDIGILRAIGSRSADVFRIFFAESFIIAMINYVLSVAGTLTVTIVINNLLRNEAGLLITFLGFGIRQVLILLGVSLAVAFIATFLPVKKIASMKPIDAIKNRK